MALGGLVEAVKATAGGGTKNARGDFTVEELRDLAPHVDGRVVDRCIDRGTAVLELERAVRRLEGRGVGAVRQALDDTLELAIARARLRLSATGWLLRRDGEELARAADEPAWTLEQLRALEGRTVTRAGFRRRDCGLALEFDDDPFAPAFELLVRGGRAPWTLTTADGVAIGSHGRA